MQVASTHILLKSLARSFHQKYQFDAIANIFFYNNHSHCSSSKIKETYPGIHIAGINDGYFKDDSYIVETIKNSNPDIILVALGFPKQEFFINKYRHISDSIWMGVGGSFDVLAGYSKRAPIFWQKHHLEWFYRLLQEPQRIIRMMALPKYMLLIYREKFLKK